LLSDADNLSLQVALCSFALDLAPSADCWRYRGRLVIRLSGKELHVVDEMERSSDGQERLGVFTRAIHGAPIHLSIA
jgi:hypothetical protein